MAFNAAKTEILCSADSAAGFNFPLVFTDHVTPSALLFLTWTSKLIRGTQMAACVP